MDKKLQELMFDHKRIIRDGQAPGEQDVEFMNRLDQSFIKINDYLMSKDKGTHDEDPFESMSKNSAHSFTDGMHTTVEDLSGEKLGANSLINDLELDNAQANSKATVEDRFAACSLDQQIAFMKEVKDQYGNKATDPKMSAIIHNLESIKRWNESPTEKVIEDLIQVIADAGLNRKYGVPISEIQNAEAALGMLQAFKGEREELGTMIETTRRVGKGRSTIRPLTQEDVEAAHQAGRGVMESYIPSSKRDELNLQIVRLINAGWNTGSIANAIIYATEEMDRLRKV